MPKPTPAAGRRVTIRDVARASNASTAAVSRVLRDAYGVSDGMALRVREAMEQLGYRPHAAARGMRGRTYTVGVVHPDLHNSFFPDLISAIAAVVLPTSRQIFLATTEWSGEVEVISAMHDRQLEGLVLIAPHLPDTELQKAGKLLPIVVTHRHSFSDHFDTVVSDDEAGAEAAVRHLVELGHKSIAHLGPSKSRKPISNVAARRVRSYKRTMEQLGLGEYAEVVHVEHYAEHEGFLAARELFARKRLPTAVFAGSDSVAMGVMQAAYEANLRIPDDVSLVGYDNTPIAALGPISLTSVDQGPASLGRTTAELLLSRIEGRRTSERSVFQPRLIVRNTSGPPR